jgi:hypothetical protein
MDGANVIRLEDLRRRREARLLGSDKPIPAGFLAICSPFALAYVQFSGGTSNGQHDPQPNR